MIDQIFNDMHQSTIVDQQRSELYMRLNQYMSQDFVNNQDMIEFSTLLVAWCQSVEDRLIALSAKMASHTHEVPAHTHSIAPHTHIVPPHIHATPSGPSSPSPAVPTDGGTLVTTGPSSIVPTGVPAQDLSWPASPSPKVYMNTSGTITNLNNKVMVGSGVIGDAVPHLRRSTPEPKSLAPVIPPYLKPTPL